MESLNFTDSRITRERDEGTLWLCLKIDPEDRPKAQRWVYEHRGKQYTLTLKERKQKRSLDANAYCWALLDKMSAVLGIPKQNLYRELIKDVGGNCFVGCYQDSAVPAIRSGWERNGLGWLTEVTPSKLDGCTNVLFYVGSSEYDTAQMSRLIDLVVQECKQLGIETMTQDKLAALKEDWDAPRNKTHGDIGQNKGSCGA